MSYEAVEEFYSIFSRLDTEPMCDRQTGGQTDGLNYCNSIALCTALLADTRI